jgi:predicted peptidase
MTVLVSAITFFGSLPVLGQTVSPLPVLPPGLHSQTLLRAGEPAIRYAIFIPATYSPSVRVPLILALHYGGNPRGAGQGVLEILVRPALADLGAIMIAPDSLGGPWDTSDNERAINLLLDAVLAGYSIDAGKVAVTGFSMGGAGAWHFAAKYPERFSAAVPVAGRPTASVNGRRLPVLAIHSRNDDVMPIAPTEARIAELQKAGVRAEMITLTGITHYETYRFVDGLRRAVPWLKDTWK